MGKQVHDRSFEPDDRHRYRVKMQRGLDALAKMLEERHFSFPHQQMGLELELNLVDHRLQPSMSNRVVVEKINDSAFTTELGQYNLEFNVPPRPLIGDELSFLERDLCETMNTANEKASDAGVKLVTIGTLPTLRKRHLALQWISDNPRYALLNDQLFAEKGEDMLLSLRGKPLNDREHEQLRLHTNSILPESACTSTQLHLQVAPEDFATHWNAAQCLAAIQLALGANSPFLLGKALWQETRIPLFLQATDTRCEELKNQGVRPRVWFGERWITSIFELFEENSRFFPPLLPEADEQDPLEALESGHAPNLSEIRLHNGTIWRWNRPVYDLVDGVPHVRIENRVLPAGPTVVDTIANAAFFFGAQRALAEQERPLWTRLSFSAAEDNFHTAAKHGMDAHLQWPGWATVTPHELVLDTLLPMAREGLLSYGMPPESADRHLRVIEGRCRNGRTGASWQRDAVAALEQRGLDRRAALTEMLRIYVELMDSGEPVHGWPLPSPARR